MLRLLHTADWHLGQTLHGVDRAWEHEQFLTWLLDELVARDVDVLVVAGDIFDVAHPTSSAQRQYYRFIADARQRCPRLTLVVIGGNHDSPARLDAPAAIMDALGVRIIGGLDVLRAGPRGTDLAEPASTPIIPLPDRTGTVRGWMIAIPFLRPRDLPGSGTLSGDSDAGPRAHDRLIEGHRRLYAHWVDVAEGHRTDDQALIATGHCYMAGGRMSDLSERKIQVGHQHALPVDIFPPQISYVALGHLHRAQAVGDHSHIRYSGSPLPLSLNERDYPHQVVQVDFDGPRIQSITAVPTPKTVQILRIPEEPAPLAEILPMLEALPKRAAHADEDDRHRPFLEVRVRLNEAQPRLRQDVAAALGDAWARLLRIDVVRDTPAQRETWDPSAPLDRLTPDQVFEACYQRTRAKPPSDELKALFLDLVQSVQRGETP